MKQVRTSYSIKRARRTGRSSVLQPDNGESKWGRWSNDIGGSTLFLFLEWKNYCGGRGDRDQQEIAFSFSLSRVFRFEFPGSALCSALLIYFFALAPTAAKQEGERGTDMPVSDANPFFQEFEASRDERATSLVLIAMLYCVTEVVRWAVGSLRMCTCFMTRGVIISYGHFVQD